MIATPLAVGETRGREYDHTAAVWTPDASGTTVRWASVNGKRYQVSSRTNVLGETWQNIGSPVAATGTNAQYLDTTAKTGTRFYRVQALP